MSWHMAFLLVGALLLGVGLVCNLYGAYGRDLKLAFRCSRLGWPLVTASLVPLTARFFAWSPSIDWPMCLFAVALLLIVLGVALVCGAEQEKARRDATGDLDADTTSLMFRWFGGSMAVVVAAVLLFVLSLHHFTRG